MAFVQLQCSAWDKVYRAQTDLPVKVFDRVIIKTEAGLDLARIIDVLLASNETPDENLTIVRLAEAHEIASAVVSDEEKQLAMETCQELIIAHALDMKLADAHFSLDKSRITFAFTAEGRIDFRALVKDLSRRFGKNIRLQQIGIRDEARALGDIGRCGRGLCCKGHLTKFNSVTSDMAEAQALNTRGSDRISGSCGRLMCCLAYETQGYKEMLAELPAIGSKITFDGRKGTVIGHHILKQTVDVQFEAEANEDRVILEIDLRKTAKKKD